MTEQEYLKQIEETVKTNKIVLFTKGTKEMPRCGFSASAIECFKALKVPFETVDVLLDPNFRPALVKFSNWPTTPQVFVGGKLIGGADITQELFASGELKKLVDQALA